MLFVVIPPIFVYKLYSSRYIIYFKGHSDHIYRGINLDILLYNYRPMESNLSVTNESIN